MIGGLMPLNYGVTNNGYYFLKMVYENILYAVDIGPSIILSTIAITIILIIEEPLVYSLEINASFLITKLSICILTFGVCTLLGMVVVYIVQIKGQLVKLMVENLNLLDKMDEGLIVISEKDLSIRFASRPAVALLKQLPKSEWQNLS